MNRTMKKIYQLGPSFKTQGGISSVLNTYYLYYRHRMNMNFISTYSGQNRFKDVVLFLCALMRVFFISCFGKKAVFQIHSSTYGSFIRKSILARICMKSGHQVVFHIHGADFDTFIEEASPGIKNAIVNFLNKVDRLVVLSESWKAFFSEYVPENRIFVLYNPIQEVLPAYSKASGSPVRVLFMGRMGNRKGTYDLLEAARMLKGEDFLLELYGDGEIRNIRELVDTYGMQEHVKVNGWVSHRQVAQIYDAADVLVLPSYSEGLPMSVIEAMGRGLPVVASDVGGIPEAVTDGENGFIIKPGDAAGLAEKLKILIKDSKLRERMGRASLEAARGKFSVAMVGAELEKLYMGLKGE